MKARYVAMISARSDPELVVCTMTSSCTIDRTATSMSVLLQFADNRRVTSVRPNCGCSSMGGWEGCGVSVLRTHRSNTKSLPVQDSHRDSTKKRCQRSKVGRSEKLPTKISFEEIFRIEVRSPGNSCSLNDSSRPRTDAGTLSNAISHEFAQRVESPSTYVVGLQSVVIISMSWERALAR